MANIMEPYGCNTVQCGTVDDSIAYLNRKITNTETNLASLANSVKQLTANVGDNQSNISAIQVKLTAARTDLDSLAKQFVQLNIKEGEFEARVNNALQTLTDLVNKYTATVQSLGANVATNTAAIAELKALVNPDKLKEIDQKLAELKSFVKTEITAQVGAAVNALADDVNGKVNNQNGAISNANENANAAAATANKAIEQISAVSGRLNNAVSQQAADKTELQGQVDNERTRALGAETAIRQNAASAVAEAKAKVDDLQTQITHNGTRIDDVVKHTNEEFAKRDKTHDAEQAADKAYKEQNDQDKVALDNKICDLNKDLTKRLETETKARTDGDKELADKLEAEQTARETKDKAQDKALADAVADGKVAHDAIDNRLAAHITAASNKLESFNNTLNGFDGRLTQDEKDLANKEARLDLQEKTILAANENIAKNAREIVLAREAEQEDIKAVRADMLKPIWKEGSQTDTVQVRGGAITFIRNSNYLYFSHTLPNGISMDGTFIKKGDETNYISSGSKVCLFAEGFELQVNFISNYFRCSGWTK